MVDRLEDVWCFLGYNSMVTSDNLVKNILCNLNIVTKDFAKIAETVLILVPTGTCKQLNLQG